MKDTLFSEKNTINCKGNVVFLDEPKVMGILNVTPDSFYTKSRVKSVQEITNQTGVMLNEGAEFIDVGGFSSRPGADEVSTQEEADRVLPAIERLVKDFPNIIISVDTFRSEVAKKAITAGAAIINDISGGHLDKNMHQTIADLHVPYIAMHMKGTVASTHEQTSYTDIISEITHYFSEIIQSLTSKGVSDIILDPGYGFSKTLEQNYKVLTSASAFSIFGLPILTGISRKSMICKALNVTPENALSGTTAANMIALQQGSKILRVHDVKPAVEAIKIHSFVNENSIRE